MERPVLVITDIGILLQNVILKRARFVKNWVIRINLVAEDMLLARMILLLKDVWMVNLSD